MPVAQNDDGTFNFDKSTTVDPLTGGAVTSWYLPGQTYDSQFGSLASAREECRAECVGLFLCVQPSVLDIFGHGGADGGDIVYINWLSEWRRQQMGV